MTTEKWRAIDGFEGLYYVSNFGRVKKKDPITQKEKIITPHFDPKGHITVRLRTDGKEYYLYLKNLVLEAFQDKRNRPIGFKNSDRRDCRLENLFYIENIYEQKDWNIHLGFGLWKEHPSHQGLVISDKGQVYSKGKFTKSRGGYRLKKGKILATSKISVDMQMLGTNENSIKFTDLSWKLLWDSPIFSLITKTE